MGINWTLCFLCQKRKRKEDDLRSTVEGIEKLSKMLEAFQNVNGLKFSLDSLKGNHDSVEAAPKQNNAKYHKNCYNDYKLSKLERAEDIYNESMKTENETVEQLCSPSQSTRSRDTSSHLLGKLICCFCSEPDSADNLVAAGTFHATKSKTDPNHVSNLTQKWKMMAAKLDHTELLSRLATGDIVSNELYYHKSKIRNCCRIL